MPGEQVHLLDAGGVAGRNGEEMIAQRGHASAALAREADGTQVLGACSLQCGDDIAAVAAGGDADDQVSGLAQCLHLAGKDGIKAVIVADGGQNRGVRGERNRGHAATFAAEAPDDLCGQMLGVGGAATIAAPQDAVAVGQGLAHGMCNAFELLLLGGDSLDEIEVVGKGAEEDRGRIGLLGHGISLAEWRNRHGMGRASKYCCYDNCVTAKTVGEVESGTGVEPPVTTVFLDRDGVINRKLPEGEYVSSWERFSLLPGVLEAIRALKTAGLRVVVVTNQRGVALGRYSTADVEAIHARLQALLTDGGPSASTAGVDAFFYCPHDKRMCRCRKPLPGMFEQAQAAFPQIVAERSVMVGDSLSDIEFGRAVGMRTIFVRGDAAHRKPGWEQGESIADAAAEDLPAAVRLLLADQASSSASVR